MSSDGVGGVRGLFRGLAISASGMSAQRKRMDVIAMNIANAETTRTEQGGAYRRQAVSLERTQSLPERRPTGGVPSIGTPDVPKVGSFPEMAEQAFGVRAGEVIDVDGEGDLVYEPGHPDADESGYVRYPNVDLVRETIDLMETRRAYEANATVFEAVKSMLQRATRI